VFLRGNVDAQEERPKAALRPGDWPASGLCFIFLSFRLLCDRAILFWVLRALLCLCLYFRFPPGQLMLTAFVPELYVFLLLLNAKAGHLPFSVKKKLPMFCGRKKNEHVSRILDERSV
jgi:hypothetical protein